MIRKLNKKELKNAIIIEFPDYKPEEEMKKCAQDIQEETGYRVNYICVGE